MRVAVLIASYSRPEILSDTLESILKQTHTPDGIHLALCDPSHALDKWHQDSRITVHQTERGQCKQLNTVIKDIADQYDVIAFFDDDTELDPLYLENALHAFSEKDILSLTGSPIADGNITREEAIELLAKDKEAQRLPKDYYDNNGHWQLYGCNMMIASSALKQELFDERLPDSGYMNDLDISVRVGRLGRQVCHNGCRMVHLQVPGWRPPGQRFGYAQITIAHYLHHKGIIGYREFFKMIFWNIPTSNIYHWVKGDSQIDRWGRLKGNLLAYQDIIVQNSSPETINQRYPHSIN